MPPDVPPPDQCPPRFLPEFFRNTIMDSVEVRSARGRTFEEMDGTPGSPDSALWARVPGHLTPSAATLAIFGDYVSGAVSQPIGRRAMGRSLDNTLRMVQLKPTEWVLCDIRIHALVGGYGQGIAFLWSEDGDLLATASQSIARAPVAGGRRTPRLTWGAMTVSPPNRETVPHGPPRRRPGRRRPSGKVTAAALVVVAALAAARLRGAGELGSRPPRRTTHAATHADGHDHDRAAARRRPPRRPTTTTTRPGRRDRASTPVRSPPSATP